MRFFTITLMALLLSMTLTTGMIGFTHAQAQNQEQTETIVASVVVEEEAPKLCKDEAGQDKACENSDLFKHLMVSAGGLKGASALAIAFFITKLLLLFILSPFGVGIMPFLKKGHWKLSIAYGLNLAVGVMALMIADAGVSLGMALVHSNTLALASIFANQAFKQYLTSKGKS